jgi:hypothetical protein
MKKRNIILISLVSIIILASLACYLLINSKSRSIVGGVNEFRPYWGPLKGNEVTINEAQSYLPFKVSLPNKLGNPVLIKVIEESKFLYVIYLEKKPTPDMSFDNIIDSGAIVLMEYPNTSLEDGKARIEALTNTIKEMIETGEVPKDTPVPQKVNINGQPGLIGGRTTVFSGLQKQQIMK